MTEYRNSSTPDLDKYWTLVDRARASVGTDPDADEVAAALVDMLAQGGPEQVLAADRAYTTLAGISYGWPLWGAAYVINGGCSDDGFDYFRGWLIAQGRAVFESALADPDSLATYLSAEDALTVECVECEDMLGVSWDAYRRITGQDLPPGPDAALPELGEEWDFDDADEMRSRYPRLTAIFG